MRRGFKAEAERIATETRKELGSIPRHKLDPLELTDRLSPFPSWNESIVRWLRTSEQVQFGEYFTYIEPDSFSAVIVFIGQRRLIVHNESHHPNRKASNICHEISQHC